MHRLRVHDANPASHDDNNVPTATDIQRSHCLNSAKPFVSLWKKSHYGISREEHFPFSSSHRPKKQSNGIPDPRRPGIGDGIPKKCMPDSLLYKSIIGGVGFVVRGRLRFVVRAAFRRRGRRQNQRMKSQRRNAAAVAFFRLVVLEDDDDEIQLLSAPHHFSSTLHNMPRRLTRTR